MLKKTDYNFVCILKIIPKYCRDVILKRKKIFRIAQSSTDSWKLDKVNSRKQAFQIKLQENCRGILTS